MGFTGFFLAAGFWLNSFFLFKAKGMRAERISETVFFFFPTHKHLEQLWPMTITDVDSRVRLSFVSFFFLSISFSVQVVSFWTWRFIDCIFLFHSFFHIFSLRVTEMGGNCFLLGFINFYIIHFALFFMSVEVGVPIPFLHSISFELTWFEFPVEFFYFFFFLPCRRFFFGIGFKISFWRSSFQFSFLALNGKRSRNGRSPSPPRFSTSSVDLLSRLHRLFFLYLLPSFFFHLLLFMFIRGAFFPFRRVLCYVFTGFRRDLLSFPRFLPGFTGFYWVLPSFSAVWEVWMGTTRCCLF